MFSTKFIAVLYFVSCLAVVFANKELTEEDLKTQKMLFCVGCKNKQLQPKVDKFYECMKEGFPDYYKRGTDIHNSHEKDVDGCWTEMKKLLDEVKNADKGNADKIHACLKNNIGNYKDIETCH